jgi:hypothetical protein
VIRLQKTENKERAVAKIQRKRIKVLRKMFKARKNIDARGKRDIIKEYSNFGSVVYAPITRDGLPLDKKASKYEVQPDALMTYNGVTELSNSLPTFTFRAAPNKFKFSTKLTRNQNHHKQKLIEA